LIAVAVAVAFTVAVVVVSAVVEVEVIRRHVKVLVDSGELFVVVRVAVSGCGSRARHPPAHAPSAPGSLDPQGGAVGDDVRGSRGGGGVLGPSRRGGGGGGGSGGVGRFLLSCARRVAHCRSPA
jgi:uncharacterized membrane protein YgcG